MKNSKLFVAVLMAAMIALAAGVSVEMLAQEAQKPESALTQDVISQLFTARLNDANGKVQDFAQWKNKTLVINFWATWCPPCREEMPELSQLQTKYAGKDVQFVGIALDTSANILNYTKQHPVSYPLIVADADGAELTRLMGNSRLALPYTVVIDSEGKPQLTYLGRVTEQDLDNLLHKITNQ